MATTTSEVTEQLIWNTNFICNQLGVSKDTPYIDQAGFFRLDNRWEITQAIQPRGTYGKDKILERVADILEQVLNTPKTRAKFDYKEIGSSVLKNTYLKSPVELRLETESDPIKEYSKWLHREITAALEGPDVYTKINSLAKKLTQKSPF